MYIKTIIYNYIQLNICESLYAGFVDSIKAISIKPDKNEFAFSNSKKSKNFFICYLLLLKIASEQHYQKKSHNHHKSKPPMHDQNEKKNYNR